MQVKSIAEWEHSAILLTSIKLTFVIKIFVLSVVGWPFKTGFTVVHCGTYAYVTTTLTNLSRCAGFPFDIVYYDTYI